MYTLRRNRRLVTPGRLVLVVPLNTWRRQRARGELQGLPPAKRGRKADPQAAEIVRLQWETERLTAQLARAELIIDVQKKFHSCSACPRCRATSSNDRNH